MNLSMVSKNISVQRQNDYSRTSYGSSAGAVLTASTVGILTPYWEYRQFPCAVYNEIIYDDMDALDKAFEETLKIHKDGLKLLAQ